MNRGAGGGRPRPSRAALAALLPPDWVKRAYLAIDVETTGLDAKTCRVVEIGALLFVPAEGSYDGRKLESLVNPGVRIPAAVTAIHGIGDADVKAAPSFAGIAEELARLAEGAVIVAHNAPFDIGFIQGELARAGRPPLRNAVLDSLVMARAAFPGLPSYSLPRLVTSLSIKTSRSHRALDDARAAAEVFVRAAQLIGGGTLR